MQWPTVTVMTACGPAQAIAPAVISASRATDIPAFYAPWFFNRLQAGHLLWTNPFNRRPQHVALTRARALVFWSKNPAPLLPFLSLPAEKGMACVLHFTLNDYEDEGWEPHLPPLEQRVDTFRRLARLMGPERLVWRFDPLLLAGHLAHAPDACKLLLDKAERVGRAIVGCTRTLIFSFADIADYRKAQCSLRRNGLAWRDFTPPETAFVAQGMARIAASLGMQARACGEAADLAAWGVARAACLDPELLLRTTGRHPDILQTAGAHLPFLPGLPPALGFRRDRGQRPHCLCLPAKDVGQYDTCPHGCVYCYATRSRQTALARWQAHDPRAESIAPAARFQRRDGASGTSAL